MADPNEQSKPEESSEPGSTSASDGPPSGSGEPAAPSATSAETSQPAKKRAKSAPEGGSVDRNKRIREEAAAKRRAKREDEERRAAPARNLDAGEIVDDALVRTTHAVGSWLKKNLNAVQWIVVLGVVGGLGYQIYSYRQGLAVDRAAEEILRGLRAERGRIGAPESPGPDRYTGLSDTRQEFADDAARLKAAEAEYRKAESATSGATSALATLGLAGVLYDQGKYAEAQKAYEKVKASGLGEKDRDARARAIEGSGLALEAQGKADAALAAYKELANTEVPGMKDLGEYHQARVLVAKGDRAKAKELLTKLVEKLGKAEEKDRAGQLYVERQARQLLAVIDPNAVPKSSGITPEQLERLKAQLKMQSGQGGPDAAKLEDVLKQLGNPVPAPAGSGAPAAPAGSAP